MELEEERIIRKIELKKSDSNENGPRNGPVKVLSGQISGHFDLFVKYWPDNF